MNSENWKLFMRPMKRFVAIFSLLFFVGCLSASYLSNGASKKRQLNPAHLAGGILVRFNQHDVFGPLVDDEPEFVLQAREARYRSDFESERGLKLRPVVKTPRGQVSLLDVPQEDVYKELQQLKVDPRVDNACPNWLVSGGLPPEAGGSYALHITGTGQDGKIVIGDLDAGLRQSDFEGKLYTIADPNGTFHGFTILDGQTTNTPEEDPGWRHGSATAGIIELNFQQGAQMLGKDFQSLIFPIRVLKPTNLGNEADLIAGMSLFLSYAKSDPSIRALNMSLIGYGYDPFFEEMLGDFFSIGGVAAVSAGNGVENVGGRDLTNSPLYPGGFFQRTPMAVVGATDQGHPAGFSDFYSRTTTWAEGISVDTGIGMTLSGTSASAPQVTAGGALRLVLGDTAAKALQSLAYSANPNPLLAGRVIQNGGVYSLHNLLMENFWVGNLRTPVTLALNKAKAGKFTGTVSDPSVKIYVLGYLGIDIQVQADGSFAKKNPGFNHTPVWVGCPDGWAVSSAKVKGL